MDKAVSLLAKVDTGASFCIFQREHAEALGIEVASGLETKVSTANGYFGTYAHPSFGLVHHDESLFLSHYDD